MISFKQWLLENYRTSIQTDIKVFKISDSDWNDFITKGKIK